MVTITTVSGESETRAILLPNFGCVCPTLLLTTVITTEARTTRISATLGRSRITKTVPAHQNSINLVEAIYLSLCTGLLKYFISAGEVANLAGVDVKREVFDALEMNAYCVTSAVDYLINVRQPPYGAFDWVTLLISFAGLICLTFSFAIWIILIIFVMY